MEITQSAGTSWRVRALRIASGLIRPVTTYLTAPSRMHRRAHAIQPAHVGILNQVADDRRARAHEVDRSSRCRQSAAAHGLRRHECRRSAFRPARRARFPQDSARDPRRAANGPGTRRSRHRPTFASWQASREPQSIARARRRSSWPPSAPARSRRVRPGRRIADRARRDPHRPGWRVAASPPRRGRRDVVEAEPRSRAIFSRRHDHSRGFSIVGSERPDIIGTNCPEADGLITKVVRLQWRRHTAFSRHGEREHRSSVGIVLAQIRPPSAESRPREMRQTHA